MEKSLLLKSALSFRSIFFDLLRSFRGLWLLFCLSVIEFFKKFLLLDRLFLSIFLIDRCLELESYFSLRSVRRRKSLILPRVIILLLLIFFIVLSFCELNSLSICVNDYELPNFRDLYDFY